MKKVEDSCGSCLFWYSVSGVGAAKGSRDKKIANPKRNISHFLSSCWMGKKRKQHFILFSPRECSGSARFPLRYVDCFLTNPTSFRPPDSGHTDPKRVTTKEELILWLLFWSSLVFSFNWSLATPIRPKYFPSPSCGCLCVYSGRFCLLVLDDIDLLCVCVCAVL